MKIYTGTGDRGKTSLFSGQRVSKADARIEAYGDMDELNSIIGALVASLGPEHSGLVEELQQIQTDLFTIGALLATTPDSPSMDTIAGIGHRAHRISGKIHRSNGRQRCPNLKASFFPVVIRRPHGPIWPERFAGERNGELSRFLDASLKIQAPDSYQRVLIYINRLSDYLFVVARYCNHLFDAPEKLWQK